MKTTFDTGCRASIAAAPESRAAMEHAQARWAQVSVRARLEIIRALRHLIAENAGSLAAAAAWVRLRPTAEKLVSEVLPLADACRWLEKNAASILKTRRHGIRGRPFWMTGLTFDVQRQPFGIVLVIGPANYPLFLPAVHTLQALVAGNAVRLKPAPGTREVALVLARCAVEAGLDPDLLEVLLESSDAARAEIARGVDKVVFTGSSANGRDVLAQLATGNTPSVMELSGDDAVIVLPDADLDLVVRALRFGTRLNAGETCIAPRRLIVHAAIESELRLKLDAAGVSQLRIEPVRDEAAASVLAGSATCALGASIFSRDVNMARQIAAGLKTGFVTINDIIAPTADPRMPFGGVKGSGFGTTRGAEGLLEMTYPHVVAVRRGTARPHFDEPAPDDAQIFSAYIRAAHGRTRLAAMRELIRAIFAVTRTRKSIS